jgi:hypothetical protein
VKALLGGDVVKVHLALIRAFKAGYDEDYIAKKIGISEEELTEKLSATTL